MYFLLPIAHMPLHWFLMSWLMQGSQHLLSELANINALKMVYHYNCIQSTYHILKIAKNMVLYFVTISLSTSGEKVLLINISLPGPFHI